MYNNEINKDIQDIFDKIIEYCLSLGDNIIKDVRTHRIVFCKTINFRWFVDIKPQKNKILVKIQQDRKKVCIDMIISKDSELESVKDLINKAYKSIH